MDGNGENSERIQNGFGEESADEGILPVDPKSKQREHTQTENRSEQPSQDSELSQRIHEDQILEVREEIVFEALTMSRGPLPSPRMMEGYSKIDPKINTVIIDQFQKEGDHRRSMEMHRVEITRLGMIFGFVIALAVIGVAILTIKLGYNLTGLGALIAALASLVGVFVYGKLKNSNNSEHKNSKDSSDDQSS